jgi:pimeloyl-ACP methyl ester carboxylesterase
MADRSVEAIVVRHIGRYVGVLVLAAAILSVASPARPAAADPRPVVPAPERSSISVGGTTDPATVARRALASQPRARQSAGSINTSLNPVGPDAAGAQALAAAAFDSGGLVSASFVTVPPAYATHAVVADLGGFPAGGTTGALLTTGDSRWAPEPNVFQSSGRDSNGGIVRGERTYDVTVLKATFDAPFGTNCMSLRFRFYSEEIPEFVGRAYNDAFIAELDNNSWHTSGTTIIAPDNFANDAAGNIVSANTSGSFGMTADNALGTTYDAATPVLLATRPIVPGRHNLYLSIFDQYDAVYDSAVVVDQISFTNTSTCPSGVGAALRPIIFLPGIMGTRLITADGKEAWPRAAQTALSVSDDHLNQLKLQDDGDTNCSGCTVRPAGVITKVLWLDSYESTITFLQRAGYVLDTDGRPARGESLFMYGFDWRRAAQVNAQRLLSFIDTVRAATGFDKVNILAHSQGGLVVEATLSLVGAYGKVNRVVTLGTPYLGAAKALSVIRYKQPCMAVEIGGRCLLNRGKVQEIAKNMRGLLDLLPSDAYWWAVGSPVVRRYDADGDGQIDGPLNAGDVFRLFQGSSLYNPTLVLQSSDWHNSHDPFSPIDPNVGLVRVVGDGLSTLSSINVDSVTVCTGILWWRECHQEDRTSFNSPQAGDGTVPRGSADLKNPIQDLTGGRPAYYFPGIGHGDLPKNEAVIGYAVGVLRVNGPTAAVTSDPTTFSVTGVVAPASLTINPTPLAGTAVSVTGAVTGLLTDPDGLRTGVVDAAADESTIDIPGSSYDDGNGVALTFLTTGSATGRWTASSTGEVRITLRGYANDAVTKTVPFPPFAVGAGAVITLGSVGVPLGTVPSLSIDDNADGVADRTIAPRPAIAGAAAADTTPPTSAVTVTHYTASDGSARVHVTITATDTGGSGVDRIEWGYQPQDTDGTYTGTPLDLPAAGTVTVRGIDRAGNVEFIYPVVTLTG